MTTPETTTTRKFVEQYWEADALAALSQYITIPCLSPDFDREWESTGHLANAVTLFADWARRRPLSKIDVEAVKIEGFTPCLLIDIASTAGSAAPTTVIYGHLDKQPPLGTWHDGLDAFTPVRRGDRLFGRGSADDGYAMFAALGAIEALESMDVAHGHVVVLIEASEESGSTDLEGYLDLLADRLGDVSLIVCLDSGGASYDRLWATSSLRGLVDGVLRVEVLTEGIHSGLGGGTVPSSFRILRELLDRIDDKSTGDVHLEACRVEIPKDRIAEMDALAAASFDDSATLPVVPGLELEGSGLRSRIERTTWRAALEILGAEGLPPIPEAGNLLRPSTTVKVSLRLPPTAESGRAGEALHRALTEDPPSHARVSFSPGNAADGWNAPSRASWLDQALNEASTAYFGNPPMSYGVGGSIPFMGSLGRRYPRAQILATGVLGPESNAHGTDESLHIPAAKALTACVAHVLASLSDTHLSTID